MSVLVTGAAGFIGSHLTKRLRTAGVETVALVRPHHADRLRREYPELRVVAGDARDAATVEQAIDGCGAVFHCAALVGADTYARYPVETMAMEIESLRNVCDAALRRPGCKIVYPSTSAVYGERSREAVVDESSEVFPVSSYAIAKRYNELYLAAQFQENGLPSVSLRIFNIYGPGQDDRLVIPRFIERALRGETLTVFGDGSQQRDFIYVDDVVEAMVETNAHLDGCEIVNVASGEAVSIRSLAEQIVRGTGGTAAIDYIPVPEERSRHEVRGFVGSSAKLRGLVDLPPFTPMQSGLNATIDSMKAKHGA